MRKYLLPLLTLLVFDIVIVMRHVHSHQVHLLKFVALTFDDGPHPVYTPQVLDILEQYKVKATFFLIGRRVERYPQIARQIVVKGHEIGNHTYSHPKDLPKEDLNAIRQEIEMGAIAIEKATGVHPKLFRPPKGFLNYRVLTTAQLEGYTLVFWTVNADHEDAPTPEAMAERVLKLVHPGAIILMHDGCTESRWKDVKALPLIIEGLREQGYDFVTVSELFKLSRRQD